MAYLPRALLFTVFFVDVPAKLHEKEAGFYEVSFRPTKSGKYVIDISVVDEDGTSVRASGSPFEVIVTFKPGMRKFTTAVTQSLHKKMVFEDPGQDAAPFWPCFCSLQQLTNNLVRCKVVILVGCCIVGDLRNWLCNSPHFL